MCAACPAAWRAVATATIRCLGILCRGGEPHIILLQKDCIIASLETFDDLSWLVAQRSPEETLGSSLRSTTVYVRVNCV